MTLWATEYFKTATALMRAPNMGATGVGVHGLGAAMNAASSLRLPARQPMPSSMAPGHIVPQMAAEPANHLQPSIAAPKVATALDYFASLG